jgi:tetratricopeptide (TPR) repeat protein
MQPDAQALYERGLARFQTRDYSGAVADLEAGYAIEPRPEFLFAEGQAKRLGGDCKGAIALYQRFLATNPPAVQVNATHIALGRCAQLLAEHPEVVMVTPPPPPPAPPPPPPKWWKDPWAMGASTAGVAAIGVGLGFWIASSSSADDAARATTLGEHDRIWSTAEGRRAVADVAFVAGAVLVAAGATRFALVRRRNARHELVVPVAVGPAGIAIAGAF